MLVRRPAHLAGGLQRPLAVLPRQRGHGDGGQGVGPLAVGIVNDALKGAYGADAVRYSLLSAAVTTILGALLFVWAARSIRTDIKRAS